MSDGPSRNAARKVRGIWIGAGIVLLVGLSFSASAQQREETGQPVGFSLAVGDFGTLVAVALVVWAVVRTIRNRTRTPSALIDNLTVTESIAEPSPPPTTEPARAKPERRSVDTASVSDAAHPASVDGEGLTIPIVLWVAASFFFFVWSFGNYSGEADGDGYSRIIVNGSLVAAIGCGIAATVLSIMRSKVGSGGRDVDGKWTCDDHEERGCKKCSPSDKASPKSSATSSEVTPAPQTQAVQPVTSPSSQLSLPLAEELESGRFEQLSHHEVAKSLRQLKALHDEGILTDDEYDTKRKRLADQL